MAASLDLDEGRPPGVVRAEGTMAVPRGREAGEVVVLQPGIVFGPPIRPERLVPAFRPEIGVVGGEAVER